MYPTEVGAIYLHYKEDKEYTIYRTNVIWAEDNTGEALIEYIAVDDLHLEERPVYARRPDNFFELVPHPITKEMIPRFRPKAH